MKKGKKLLLLTAVLAVFIAGTLILKNINRAKDASENPAEEKPVVLAVDKDTLQEISYTYEGETLRFIKAEDHWQYADNPSFPLKETMVSSMADTLKNITATRTVADTLDQAEEYGLKTPSVTVTAVSTDGTKHTLYFGDRNDVTYDTYVYVEGSQTVYTVSSSVANRFKYKLYGLITDESFPDIESSAITKLTYAAPDKNLTLSYFPNGSDLSYSSLYQWFTEREDASLMPLEGDKVNTYLSSVADISTTGTLDYDASQEELAAYGLDEPEAMITVDYTVSRTETVPKATAAPTPAASPEATEAPEVLPEALPQETAEATDAAAEATPAPTPEMETITITEPKQLTIFLGKTEDGDYTLRHSDSKRVFKISESTYLKLTGLDVESLRPKQICLVHIDSVDQLIVSIGDETSTFTIERTETTNDEGKTTKETKYKREESEIGESAFKKLYSSVISLEKENTTDKTPSGQPYMTVTFRRNTEHLKELVLVLYPYDASFYQAEFNGENNILVNKRDVEAAVSAYQALLN